MLDKMYNIGSAFDWITPAVAFLKDFIYGPASDFGIPAYAGWRPRDIKRLLRRDDLRVWGFMLNFSGDTLIFTVPKSESQRAYKILQQAGVPILYAPGDTSQSSR